MKEPDVPSLLNRIPGKLLLAWHAYDQLEPIGGNRTDWAAAAIVSVLTNLNRNTKRFPQPFPVKDFLLDFGRELEQTSVRWALPEEKKAKASTDLLSIAKRVASMYNRDNEVRRRKEIERIERRMTAKPLGHGRRTRHGGRS